MLELLYAVSFISLVLPAPVSLVEPALLTPNQKTQEHSCFPGPPVATFIHCQRRAPMHDDLRRAGMRHIYPNASICLWKEIEAREGAANYPLERHANKV